MTLIKLIAPFVLAAFVSAAQAQAPGQIPGTLPPAPAVIPPPPPVAPAPVPSAVTPLPSPSYGVPRSATAPLYGRGVLSPPVISDWPPKKKRKIKRRPRTSDILLIRTI